MLLNGHRKIFIVILNSERITNETFNRCSLIINR